MLHFCRLSFFLLLMINLTEKNFELFMVAESYYALQHNFFLSKKTLWAANFLQMLSLTLSISYKPKAIIAIGADDKPYLKL